MKTVSISGDYITLGQLLKSLDIISSGGEAKIYLESYQVLVNGELEGRRGRKLYPQDVVELKQFGVIQLV